MKVLVLGSNGQVGTEVVSLFLDHGHVVFEFKRADLDLENPIGPNVLDAIDFDVLVNCAAVHKTDLIETDAAVALAAENVNVRAVGQLARICAAKKAHFIHISTDYVFGGVRHVGYLGEPVPYAETVPAAPLNIYGETKARGENAALANCEMTTIVRISAVFGHAGSSGKGGNFIETMLRMAREKKPIRVVDDQFMAPTSASCAARAIFFLASHRIPGIFHACNDGYASWFGLAAYAIQAVVTHAAYSHVQPPEGVDGGYRAVDLQPCKTADKPTPAKRPAWSVMSPQKLRSYGFEVRHWQEAVELYMADRW